MSKENQSGKLGFKFKRGHPANEITLDRLQAIVEAINMNRITGVVNGSFTRSEGGTSIICGKGKGGGTVETISNIRFEVTPSEDIVGKFATISMGTLNNAIPSIVDRVDGSLKLYQKTARETYPEIALPASGDWNIYVQITFSTGVVEIVVSATELTAPYDAASGGIGRVRLAIGNGATKLAQLTTGNLSIFAYSTANLAIVNEH